MIATLFLACAVSGQNFIAEEPDVAAARAAHYAAFAKAAAANGVAWSAPVSHWSAGPVAAPLNGIADTPEVAAAKRAFFEAYNAASRAAAENPEPQTTWSEPAPIAPVQQQWSAPVQQQWSAPVVQQTWVNTPAAQSWDLPVAVADTADVRAAKIAFFEAYNAASRAAAENPEPEQNWNVAAPVVPVQQQWSAPVQQQWSAPVVQQQPIQQTWVNTPAAQSWETPVPVADTPEVVAARSAFFQAYNAAARAAAESPERK